MMIFIMEVSTLFLILSSVTLAASSSTTLNSSTAFKNQVTDMKKEIQALKGQLATSNLMMAQMYREISAMKGDTTQTKTALTQVSQEITAVKDDIRVKTAQYGICQIMQNAPCGDCSCVEDLTLVQKYFCDCRMRPAERDCKEHYLQGQHVNGLYHIHFNLGSRHISQVFCDQTTDNGGWTVVQRRIDGSENFFRNWTEYKVGFGHLHKEHWLGNQQIYLLTSHAFLKGSQLRIDMQVKGELTRRWAKYSSFDIDGEKMRYTLHVTGFQGSTGIADRLSYHNNMKFSTYDADYDTHGSISCSKRHYGAWWYNKCHAVNLNGLYDEFQRYGWDDSISWKYYKLQFSEMKIRRN